MSGYKKNLFSLNIFFFFFGDSERFFNPTNIFARNSRILKQKLGNVCFEAQVKGMVPIKLSLLSWHLVTPVLQDFFFSFFLFFRNTTTVGKSRVTNHTIFFLLVQQLGQKKNEFNDA